ncbi:hypothetical protein MHBO_002630, partial [Bonamia ostreae]
YEQLEKRVRGGGGLTYIGYGDEVMSLENSNNIASSIVSMGDNYCGISSSTSHSTVPCDLSMVNTVSSTVSVMKEDLRTIPLEHEINALSQLVECMRVDVEQTSMLMMYIKDYMKKI